MTRRFTDAENTGAPMVPMETADARRSNEGDREFLEEMVWSHRME
jgi:hypothetical protein